MCMLVCCATPARPKQSAAVLRLRARPTAPAMTARRAPPHKRAACCHTMRVPAHRPPNHTHGDARPTVTMPGACELEMRVAGCAATAKSSEAGRDSAVEGGREGGWDRWGTQRRSSPTTVDAALDASGASSHYVSATPHLGWRCQRLRACMVTETFILWTKATFLSSVMVIYLQHH